MKKQLMYLLAATAVATMVFVSGCQKEESFELPDDPAKGSLQADGAGDCLPKTVNGIYSAGAALLPGTNTLTVQVNVSQTGTYVVGTDTVNGYFFRATGTFTTLGAATVTLRGNGTPFAQGINNFVVSFDGTVCDIAVTVLPAGAGAAVYTANCATATVNGTYTAGTNLTAANTIVVPITVTTAGAYNINTSINGMTFTGSGSLTLASTSITLTGVTTTSPTGPAATYNLPVGACTVPIPVAAGAGAAVFTANCATATVNGTYTVGTNLTASNTIVVPVTVTTAGTYNINTSINGMTFTGSGSLTLASTTLTLNGSTTTSPTGPAGTYNLPVGACTVPIPVTAAAGAAVFTANCATATVNGTYTVGTNLTASNTIVVPVTVTTAGTYNINTSINGMTFTGSGSMTLATTSITLTGSTTTSPTGPAGTYNLPVGACTVPIPVVAAPVNDYFPRTANSNWSYEFDDNVDPLDTLLRKALSNTISAGGNAFTIFMSDDGTGFDSSGYFRKSGTDYYEWFDWSNYYLSGITAPAWVEYIQLKESAPVGPTGTWSSGTRQVTTASGSLYLQIRSTIIQKNVPITITTSLGAVTYQNVIEVEERIWGSADGTTGWQDLSGPTAIDFYVKFWYARGVGLIKFEAFDSGGSFFKQELRRHNVF